MALTLRRAANVPSNPSQLQDLNLPPAHYKCAALPDELNWHVSRFSSATDGRFAGAWQGLPRFVAPLIRRDRHILAATPGEKSCYSLCRGHVPTSSWPVARSRATLRGCARPIFASCPSSPDLMTMKGTPQPRSSQRRMRVSCRSVFTLPPLRLRVEPRTGLEPVASRLRNGHSASDELAGHAGEVMDWTLPAWVA